MSAKVFNAPKNARAINETAQLGRSFSLSRWTPAALRTLVNEDGSDVTCQRCGLNIRHSIGMGGPTMLWRQRWRFDGERWEHNCSPSERGDE